MANDENGAARVQRLGSWLEAARQRWHWTRPELQVRSGLSPRHQLTMLQGGTRRVNSSTLEGIARATGVTVSELWRVMEGERVELPDVPPERDRRPAHLQEADAEVSALRTEVRELRMDVDILARRVADLLVDRQNDRSGR